ncbi:MAG: tetratricopeptide repeat protein [Candidatus Omnitrophota bacterium]|nr:tetratricopeptide repeat protein [Candidatus Omnitrophota bacterium]
MDFFRNYNFKSAINRPWVISVVLIALIAIVGFYIYANCLDGKFIWDDVWYVKNNFHIKHWSHIRKIFTSDIYLRTDFGTGNAFYRPLQMFSYMIDYSVWKLNVKGYHLSNIALHILTALSIYWLINILWRDQYLSLFTALLFITHPIHTEAVDYIAGRADSLAALFVIISFVLYIKQIDGRRMGISFLMLASYILALLSKEYSLILLGVLLLYSYTFKRSLKNRGFYLILIASFSYILLRLTILKKLLIVQLSFDNGFLERIPGFFVAITNYIRLLVFPFNLHMEYGIDLFDIRDPKAIAGALSAILLLFFAFKKRKTDKLAFFSVSWFFITLLPVSNLYPINAYMAEHWLYLPSLGFFLIVARFLWSLFRTARFRSIALFCVLALASFYSYLTIKQNEYWRDPIVFFQRTLEYSPYSARLYLNLANAYSDSGRYDEAIGSYKKAIELLPDCADAYTNFGVVYSRLGRHEEAIALYKKAIEIAPDNAQAYTNLGNAYMDIGRHNEAIVLYRKAIEINKGHAEAYYNLGVAYDRLENPKEAIIAYRKAIEINPAHTDAYYNLGILYVGLGDKLKAIEFFKKSIEADPDNIDAAYNLEVMRISQGSKN